MVDWDTLVLAPLVGIFGEPATYLPATGGSFDIDGVFDEAYVSVDSVTGLASTSVSPIIGVRLAQFPLGYDPQDAQDDQLIIKRTGVLYVVKTGRPDGHGGARLDLNLA